LVEKDQRINFKTTQVLLIQDLLSKENMNLKDLLVVVSGSLFCRNVPFEDRNFVR
jgi:hypothetical protein